MNKYLSKCFTIFAAPILRIAGRLRITCPECHRGRRNLSLRAGLIEGKTIRSPAQNAGAFAVVEQWHGGLNCSVGPPKEHCERKAILVALPAGRTKSK